MLKIIHDLATSSLSKETKKKKVGELAEMAKCEEERERLGFKDRSFVLLDGRKCPFN